MHGLVTHLIDKSGNLRARYHGPKFDPVNMVVHINALTTITDTMEILGEDLSRMAAWNGFPLHTRGQYEVGSPLALTYVKSMSSTMYEAMTGPKSF